MRCTSRKSVKARQRVLRARLAPFYEQLEQRVLLSSAALSTTSAVVRDSTAVSAARRDAVVALVAQPTVATFQLDDGSAQRSIIRSLTIHFNNPVTLGTGAITLTTNAGAVVPFTMSSSDPQTYLLNFNGSLPDGRYVLTVHAAGVRDSSGQMPAADQTYSFFRFFGDFDGNGTVNSSDYFKFKSAFGTNSANPAFLSQFDYDGNGTINSFDYLQFVKRFRQGSLTTTTSTDVLTWHDDVARTGVNATETQLTPANVNSSSFGKLFSEPLDGQLYAEPLYVSHLNMGALGTHDVVFVATEHNSVYAFDADNPNPATGGGLLWHVNLGTPATTPSPYIGGRYGPWTLVTPYIGIEGTPVIDRATNTMYLDSFTNDAPGVYAHHIYAMDITTGANKVAPVLVNPTYPGNGAGGNGTTIPFIANRQQQRPALTLLNGIVYVAYGSFDDTDPHHGWIVGYDAATLQLKEVWNSTPTLLTPPGANAGEGPIWQSGAGLSSDGTNLYAMTGNGDFNASLNDYADSFVKVSTANNTLALTDYFTPYNQQALTDADNDLGSAGPMVLPDSVGSAAHPHLLVGVGKQGILFLLDRDNMGHFDPATDHVLQEVQLGSGAWSNPAYFDGRIYVHGVGGVLKAFSIANGVMSTAPVAQANVTYGYPGATPNISANGTTHGIIWELQTGGVLHAYDATTLTELYNSTQAGARDQLGSYVKFTSPTIADGKVFVGTADSLVVFGMRPQDSIAGTGGNDTIILKRSTDGQNIDWTLNSGGAAPASGELPINDPAGLTISGNGGMDTITLDASKGDPLPNLLTLNGTFTINGLTASTVAAGQTIDIGASTVTIPYAAGASVLPAVQSLLKSGYSGGTWKGTGIISSLAQVNPFYGIADTDSANGGVAGQPTSTVRLQPALVADANQDGQVDQIDSTILANHLGSTGADWSQGDFNYDGIVNNLDSAILNSNLGHHRPTQVNLSSSYNLIGIVADGSTFTGGLDGVGYALSANLLGATASWKGNTYTIGAAGGNNVVQALGQTIASPPGNASTLTLLATATNGNQPAQVFTVHYTDGTSQTFTQGISDWYTPQNYAGEATAISLAYRDTSAGGRDTITPFQVYGYTFALNSAKTVASLTLPNTAMVKVLAIDLS
jgi:hypothetical protein